MNAKIILTGVLLLQLCHPFLLVAQQQVSPSEKNYVDYEINDGQTDIVIKSFLGEKKFITSNPNDDYNPQWSRNGKWIVFYRKEHEKKVSQVILYSLKTRDETTIINSGFYDADPSLSTTATDIAFCSERNGNFDLYKINIKSGEVKLLVDNTFNNWGPTWSHNDKQIAFTSDMNGNFELFTMNADGTDLKQLTKLGGENYKPDWSRGEWLAFIHRDRQDAKFDVFLVSTKTSEVKNISNTKDIDEFVLGWAENNIYFIRDGIIHKFHL